MKKPKQKLSKIVKQPSLKDLEFTPKEQRHFEDLARWQKDSAERCKLGLPPFDKEW